MIGKILKIFGGIFALIIVVGITFGIYSWYAGSKNSEESEKFARDAMAEIGKKWEPHEIMERYNPRIRKKIDSAALTRTLQTVRKDGTLKSLSNVEGVMRLIKSFEGDPDSTAVYRGELTLEKKVYVMRLYISKWNNQWFIDQIDLCDSSEPNSLQNCKLY